MIRMQSNKRHSNRLFISERIRFLLFSVCLMITVLTARNETISINGEYDAPSVECKEVDIVGKEDTWILTAYCPCHLCSNGHTTASGSYATEGRTIATGGMYPFGTQILIEGMGLYIVEDRFGGKVNAHRGDIFFENHEDAVNFGKQKRRVIILE